ncbi:MAG: hypothetical protein NTW19_08985 [Planctomycetota bacterium]|nr:hypothetical protein [Planctomycetota bacterium]
MPILMLFLVFAFFVFFVFFVVFAARRRVHQSPAAKDGGACGKCGYLVRGITALNCPECGADLREVGIATSALAPAAPSPKRLFLIVTLILAGGGVLPLLVLRMVRSAPPPAPRAFIVPMPPAATIIPVPAPPAEARRFPPAVIRHYLDVAARLEADNRPKNALAILEHLSQNVPPAEQPKELPAEIARLREHLGKVDAPTTATSPSDD